ncbi:CTAG/Pcc1 family [Usnea florida]
MLSPPTDSQWPCCLVISVPLPTHRLASSALRALSVDTEISPLVHRSFSLATSHASSSNHSNGSRIADGKAPSNGDATLALKAGVAADDEELTVLRTEYKATTNRMLRVAVNGFMESLGVVLGVMEELDVDVLAEGV